MISHHPAKFGDHRHCGNGDIMLLVAEQENPLSKSSGCLFSRKV